MEGDVAVSLSSPSKLEALVKGRTRGYSKIYERGREDREAILQEKIKAKNAHRRNDFDVFISGLSINKMLYKFVKRRLSTRFHSVRCTVENISEDPEPTVPWTNYNGSQSLCDLCNTPALRQVLLCSICNIICHRQCYQKKNPGFRFRYNHSRVSSPTTDMLSTPCVSSLPGNLRDETDDVSPTRWICLHCEESQVFETQHRTLLLEHLKMERLKEQLRRYLCRVMFSYLCRCRFLRLKAGMVVAQSLFRRKIQRRHFMKWKRTKMHVVIIELMDLPSHFSSGWITITIIDPIKPYQIMRLDKKSEKCYEEGFMIPGITLNILCVITLSDENGVILSQTKFSLKDRGDVVIIVLNFVD